MFLSPHLAVCRRSGRRWTGLDWLAEVKLLIGFRISKSHSEQGQDGGDWYMQGTGLTHIFALNMPIILISNKKIPILNHLQGRSRPALFNDTPTNKTISRLVVCLFLCFAFCILSQNVSNILGKTYTIFRFILLF